jgi:hypothetical protein
MAAVKRKPARIRSSGRHSKRPSASLTVCISCGCTDIQACVNGLGDPCHWISVDGARRRGVCSECAIRMCDALLFPEPTDADIHREIMAAARS